MELVGSILILLALLLLVGLFITRPILENKGTAFSKDDHEISALLAERDRALNALQELDFDFTLGKIPVEDYPAQRALMLQYGVEVLRKLDTHQAQASVESAEDRLEKAIAGRRTDRDLGGSLAAPTQPEKSARIYAPNDVLEEKIAERRRLRQEKAAGFCHHCGNPLQRSDQFCPRCGNRIS